MATVLNSLLGVMKSNASRVLKSFGANGKTKPN
jgi:hypothetical protein